MKFVEFVRNHSYAITINILLAFFVFALYTVVSTKYEDFMNPPALKDFGGGIQNHLVWTVRGECFFVRPHNDYTVYLIRTKDCDTK